eukprot:TRINITY_DN61369_c0_g1_i1.p1 TRINITY_DN61369_c0_g1~~TRINITY_DN61369_c0_g1_i1.p1  ORF type:complete len:606 (-),score=120.40 TRINITY_DN61369_c0_g1_i1:21-1838(-)
MWDDGAAQDEQLLEAMNVDLAELLARRVRKDLVELLDAMIIQIRQELAARSSGSTKATDPVIEVRKPTRCAENAKKQTAFVDDAALSDEAPVLPVAISKETFIPVPPALPCKVLTPDLPEPAEMRLPASDLEQLTPVLPNAPDTGTLQPALKRQGTRLSMQSRRTTRSHRENIRRTEAAEKGREAKGRFKNKSGKTASAEVIEDDGGSGVCALGLHAIRKFTNSGRFELLSMMLILLNTIFNGVEAEIMSMTSAVIVMDMLDVIGIMFNLAFALELLCRYVTHGFRLLCGPESAWARFDTVIVSLGIIESVILLLGVGSSVNPGIVRAVRMLKIARVLRVMRAVNGVRGLRILIFSIIHSCWNGVWVLIVLAVSLWSTGTVFTLAYLDVTARKTESDELDPDLEKYFGSMSKSVYTLFASVFGGIDWDTAVTPLRSIKPAWPLITVFVFFVASQYLCLVNVIMGVFCQGAMESAYKDHDMKMAELLSNKQQYVQELETLWAELDKDASGSLSLDEWEEALSDESVRLYLEGLGISTSDAWSLFMLLGDPVTGVLRPDAFLEGCLKLNGSAKSVDIAALEKTMQAEIQEIFTAIGALEKEVRKLTM